MLARVKQTTLKLWKDESAQGATEYILLLVAVVAVLALFRTQITDAVRGKLGELSGAIGEFKVQ